MESKTILVTGGCGFIGSNLIEYIHERNPTYKIINIDKLTSVSNSYLCCKYAFDSWYLEIKLDISYDEMYSYLKNSFLIDETFDIDIIIHLAAESHVDRSVESIEPFIQSNIIGITKLAEFASKFNIPMISISTDEVYGELELISDDGFTETTPINPRNPYACTKASADFIVQSIGRLNPAWNYVITRSCNNYGSLQDSTKFIPVIINSILDDKKIPVYGTGENIRQWINVLDHCSAIYVFMAMLINGFKPKHNVYNIGSTDLNLKSNIELINMICEIMDVDPSRYVQFIEDPRGSCHDKVYKIDNRRIRDEFRWYAEHAGSMITDLMSVVDYYKGLKRKAK